MFIYDLQKTGRRDAAPEISADECGSFVAALGSFDGVHAGHAALIGRAVELARERGVKSAVFTFTDDSSTLPGKSGMRSITTLSEKLMLIASLGVDYALLEDFSRIRDYSPERFVKELLIESCGVICAVCGFNFRFGAGGSGDSERLAELMPEGGCEVIEPVCRGGLIVSSSAIRRLIEAGDVETARDLLGHPFMIDFPVVHGKELGRALGIPTMNQNFPDGHIVPHRGIYACRVKVDGGDYPGVANVGVRPTVDKDSGRVNCETHIIGYSGWLYGKRIQVSFYKYLRDERVFPDVDALKAQIESDIASAKSYFEGRDHRAESVFERR